MSDYGFKVPVSGQKIPHGWFAALVRFVNSLLLHGDGHYTMVDHDENGTTVTLSPAAIAAIEKSAGAPAAPGSGVAQDLSVTVSGNTATVSLSGSTQTVQFVAGSNVSITGNTNGQVVVSATGGTASGFHAPDYSSPLEANLQFDTNYSFNQPCWLVGEAEAFEFIDGDNAYLLGHLNLHVGPSHQSLLLNFNSDITNASIYGGEGPTYWSFVLYPIPANTTFFLSSSFSSFADGYEQIRRLVIFSSL